MTDAKRYLAKRYLVRTSEFVRDEGLRICHPLNPQAEVLVQSLSDAVGLTRAALHFGRIPPGKQSGAAHSHEIQEEFIFILEGTGKCQIGDDIIDIGPGDYLGFPTDGMAHNLINDGGCDLVYLMGGERTATEVAHFPEAGKIGIWANDVMTLISSDGAERLTLKDFLKR